MRLGDCRPGDDGMAGGDGAMSGACAAGDEGAVGGGDGAVGCGDGAMSGACTASDEGAVGGGGACAAGGAGTPGSSAPRVATDDRCKRPATSSSACSAARGPTRVTPKGMPSARKPAGTATPERSKRFMKFV